MNIKGVSLWLGIMLVLFATGAAYAEALEGEVTEINLAEKNFEIEKTDKSQATVWVTDQTTYSGEVTSVEELLEGDPVKLEGGMDVASGRWVAKSVDVTLPEGEY